jgi:uncharacterized RmlC-like cupin family protein
MHVSCGLKTKDIFLIPAGVLHHPYNIDANPKIPNSIDRGMPVGRRLKTESYSTYEIIYTSCQQICTQLF